VGRRREGGWVACECIFSHTTFTILLDTCDSHMRYRVMATPEYHKAWRREHAVEVAAYEEMRRKRDRSKRNEYFKARRRAQGPKLLRQRNEWFSRTPGARKAHSAVYDAVRDGRLVKPKNCEECGEQRWLHAHHEDYCLPLIVKWLCASCHRLEHLK
jgi:hypothetical protein